MIMCPTETLERRDFSVFQTVWNSTLTLVKFQQSHNILISKFEKQIENMQDGNTKCEKTVLRKTYLQITLRREV